MLARLEVVDCMFCLSDIELKEDPEPPDIDLSPHFPSYSGSTLTSADDSDALSFRCIYTPLPEGLNHMLPSFRQKTVSLMVSMSLTAALAIISLASWWEILLEGKAEASQDNINEHSPSTHNHMNSVVEVKPTLAHFKPGPLCGNIQAYTLMLTVVLFSSVCIIRFFAIVSPKLILLKCQMHKTVLFVLYLGALPTYLYALPEYRGEKSSPGISIRQSNTVWTVQLRGWPNTGYCTTMQFGNNKQQMVSFITCLHIQWMAIERVNNNNISTAVLYAGWYWQC